MTNDNKLQHGLVHVLESSARSPSDIHGLDTSRILKLFESYGYSCKPQSNLRGISGVLHDFDFVCTKSVTREKLVLQSLLHIEDKDQFDIEVVKLRLSTYDSSPDACLIVTNNITDNLKQMTSLYRLTVIEAGKGESPYEQIESLLRLQC